MPKKRIEGVFRMILRKRFIIIDICYQENYSFSHHSPILPKLPPAAQDAPRGPALP